VVARALGLGVPYASILPIDEMTLAGAPAESAAWRADNSDLSIFVLRARTGQHHFGVDLVGQRHATSVVAKRGHPAGTV
jgi:hypothetical protein